jgi:hypothetical protein
MQAPFVDFRRHLLLTSPHGRKAPAIPGNTSFGGIALQA